MGLASIDGGSILTRSGSADIVYIRAKSARSHQSSQACWYWQSSKTLYSHALGGLAELRLEIPFARPIELCMYMYVFGDDLYCAHQRFRRWRWRVSAFWNTRCRAVGDKLLLPRNEAQASRVLGIESKRRNKLGTTDERFVWRIIWHRSEPNPPTSIGSHSLSAEKNRTRSILLVRWEERPRARWRDSSRWCGWWAQAFD